MRHLTGTRPARRSAADILSASEPGTRMDLFSKNEFFFDEAARAPIRVKSP
jgi:hypothetical protein